MGSIVGVFKLVLFVGIIYILHRYGLMWVSVILVSIYVFTMNDDIAVLGQLSEEQRKKIAHLERQIEELRNK